MADTRERQEADARRMKLSQRGTQAADKLTGLTMRAGDRRGQDERDLRKRYLEMIAKARQRQRMATEKKGLLGTLKEGMTDWKMLSTAAIMGPAALGPMAQGVMSEADRPGGKHGESQLFDQTKDAAISQYKTGAQIGALAGMTGMGGMTNNKPPSPTTNDVITPSAGRFSKMSPYEIEAAAARGEIDHGTMNWLASIGKI